MDAHIQTAETLLSLLERIVEPTTPDANVIEATSAIRVHLNGIPQGDGPAINVKWIVLHGTDIGKQLAALETEKNSLTARIALFESDSVTQSENGNYPLETFLAALQRKMGRTYGWRVDYVLATATAAQANPNVKVVKNEEIQKWQKDKEVPAWAFERIPLLVFQKRKGEGSPPWKSNDYTFLATLYLEDQHKSNAYLATVCGQKFDREITENAIKGALDRLRKKGSIPVKRPPKK